jgi:hypothetical protein
MQGNAVKAHASRRDHREGNQDKRKADEGDSLPAGERRICASMQDINTCGWLRSERKAGWLMGDTGYCVLAGRREQPSCGEPPTSEAIIDQIRIIRNNFDDKKLSLCLQLRTAMQLDVRPRPASAETAIILKELNRTHVFRKMKPAMLPLSWRHRPPLTLSTRILK